MKSLHMTLGVTCQSLLTRRVRRPSVAVSYRSTDTQTACPYGRHTTRPSPSGVRLKEPPGPRSLRLIGTLYKYIPGIGSYRISDRQRSDTARCREYGSVVREEVLPGQVFYYVYDTQLFPQILAQEGKFPFRFEMHGVREYRESRGFHPGFPNAKGEDWYKIRQATNQLTMRPAAVKSYMSAQNEIAADMVGLLASQRDAQGEVPDMVELFYRWGMESVGVVIFDTRLGTLAAELAPDSEASQFVEAANEAFTTLYDTTFYWPLHQRKNTKIWSRLCKSFDYIAKFSEEQISASLERARLSDRDDLNFLQKLSSESGLNRSEVLSVISDLFYGSVDSAAHCLAFTLYHLAINPEVQQKLRDEILAECTESGHVTPHAVDNMKYLKAVVKESLRVSPVSAFGVARTFDEDLEVEGYLIPAGSTVFLQPNLSAVSPAEFPEPQEFRPERWLRDGPDAARTNSFPMMAFGYGSRICPGKRFAEQQIYLCLINILMKFQLNYRHEKIGMKTRFTNQPDPALKLEFLDRYPATEDSYPHRYPATEGRYPRPVSSH